MGRYQAEFLGLQAMDTQSKLILSLKDIYWLLQLASGTAGFSKVLLFSPSCPARQCGYILRQALTI